MRRTKIIGTIGPASNSEQQLDALLQAGLDVIRLNMSHGKHDQHAVVVQRARMLAAQRGQALAILLDLQGPKIRTGELVDHQPITLSTGGTVTITTRPILGTVDLISTTYTALPQDVRVNDTILMDDGLLELRVTGVEDELVTCHIVHGGVLKEHKGINLPGVHVSAPAMTDKDRVDLEFGLRMGVDYVALSFVRRPEDLADARALITAYGSDTPIIAKLEKPEAIDHLDAIIDAADGVMVARGDLGVEMSPERVPLLQKHIIARANEQGKIVITATQMLESMIAQPRPTRAEASDVANAVFDDTDVVMLSGETAAGMYPVAAVTMMDRIVRATEEAKARHPIDDRPCPSHAHAIARAAAELARDVAVQAIVVFTRSGMSAQLVAKQRPTTPIIAYTASAAVYRRMALVWGVIPLLGAFGGTTDDHIARVIAALRDSGLAHPGATIILMGSLPMMEQGHANFVKIHRIEADDLVGISAPSD